MKILIGTIKSIARIKMKKRNANRSSTTRRELFVNVCLFNYICCQIMTVLGNPTSMPLLEDLTNFPKNDATSTTSSIFEQSSEFSSSTIENSSQTSNKQNKISLPTNLKAIPISPPDWKPQLQLNITWDPPEEGELDKYYVLVIPGDPNTCKISRWDTGFEIDSSIGWALVPRELSSMKESFIFPNCSYNISIRSEKLEKSVSFLYMLPECVDDVCPTCNDHHFVSPIVNLTKLGNNFNISWYLPNKTMIPPDFRISHYEVFLYKKNQSAPNFFVQLRNIVNARGLDDMWLIPNETQSTELGAEFKATVEVVDVNGCTSVKHGNITWKAEVPANPDHTAMKLMIILPLTVIFLWIVVKVSMSKLKSSQCCLKMLLASARRDQTLRRQQTWPASSRFAREGRHSSEAINSRLVEERSPLYVEKEIEEARSRGEADIWEMSPSSLHFGRLIGEGAFGRVFIARLNVPDRPKVAVKKLKENATLEEVSEFLGEIKMLKFAGKHPHVVNIIGCCTLRQPYCVILEYAENGDLLGHLRKLRDIYTRRSNSSGFSTSSSLAQQSRNPTARPSVAETEYTLLESEISVPTKTTDCSNPDTAPTLLGNIIALGSDSGSLLDPNFLSDMTGASLESDAFITSSIMLSENTMQNTERVLHPTELHRFALQIAKGMEHLEKKGITHRDLAARNVLIDGDGRLKISDLGLSRTGVYVTNNRRKVPLRWLAIEAIRNSHYSNKSDVWSYAVLLWEIGTLGGFPYPTLGDHQILPYLSEGRRLDKPVIVSQELYATMVRCWTENPEQRPNFTELVNLLEADESRNRAYVDITTLQTSVSFPPVEMNDNFEGS